MVTRLNDTIFTSAHVLHLTEALTLNASVVDFSLSWMHNDTNASKVSMLTRALASDSALQNLDL